jgi:hypothetical protein
MKRDEQQLLNNDTVPTSEGLEDKEVYDIDEAIQKAGNFGKFQFIYSTLSPLNFLT